MHINNFFMSSSSVSRPTFNQLQIHSLTNVTHQKLDWVHKLDLNREPNGQSNYSQAISDPPNF